MSATKQAAGKIKRDKGRMVEIIGMAAPARNRAVTALLEAVEHDSWTSVRNLSAAALMQFGEKRAIGTLESAASHELDSHAQRSMRAAAHVLRSGDKTDEQLKQLRKDLDQVREENRKLKEQLGALEARVK